MPELETITKQTRARLNARSKARRERRKELDQALAGKGGDWRRVDEPERILARARSLGFEREAAELTRRPEDSEIGQAVLEKIIGANNLLGVRFLFAGAVSARAVGRIRLPVSGGTRLGTGFMVTPRLMMTNNHVLNAAGQTGNAEIEFDFFERESGLATPVIRFRLEPAAFFITDQPLDFTIVAVRATNADGAAIADRGWHPLIAESGKAVVGERVNIIQHPGGDPQAVAIHENKLVDVTGDFLHYVSDTMGGSSGSPVFNDAWDVVALHHAAVAESNEGIRISSIVARIREILGDESASTGTSSALVDDLLKARPAPVSTPLRKISPPLAPPRVGPPAQPHSASPAGLSAAPPVSGPQMSADGTASWMIPIQVSVGVGGAAPSSPADGGPSRPRGGGDTSRPASIVSPGGGDWPASAPADSPVVIRFGEIQEAFERMDSPEGLLAGEGSAVERAHFLTALGESLRALEDEELEADPDVMTVPRDRLASLMLSLLAEEPPAGSEHESLEAGGLELKFAHNDVGGWLRSLFRRVSRADFHPILRPQSTLPAPLPARARFGLLADWGTGLYGAPVSAASLQSMGGFDYLFHLGDVYYAGTPKEVEKRFLQLWPRVPGAVSRALNSNHEMYSGGHAYFGQTLPAFGQASSYFALQNDHWLLLGLDTGHVDHDLDSEQVRWIEEVIAGAGDRRIALFSHHQLFSWFASQGEELAVKLAELLISGRIDVWYWGHEHRCCIFDRDPRYGGLLARCLGHGGMPLKSENLKELPVDHTEGEMIWRRREAKNLVPGGLVLDGPNEFIKGKENKYLPHGFMTLEIDGPHLVEAVHTPTGEIIFERELF